MADPFDSPKRKLARAKQHIYDFDGTFRTFGDSNPYTEIAEPHPDHPDNMVHKLKLIKPIPDILELIAADIVSNLRATLDQSVFAASVAAGYSITHAKFPFAGDAPTFERFVAGKSKYLPQEILALLRTFKAYKGGNDILCALNDWCNADKHGLLSVAETGTARMNVKVRATGFMSIPSNPVWDRAKHEIELYTIGKHTEKFEYDFGFLLFVTFDQIESIRGKEAISVFHTMAGEVQRILMAIEAEMWRLGFVK